MSLDVVKVAPRIWIGSAPPTGHAVAQGGFDVLVLCAEEWQPAASSYPGVRVLHAPFGDREDPSEDELRLALAAAEWTSNYAISGATCLVTCMAGRNRSGLVCALTVSLAACWDPARAGELVRRKRGDIALTNAAFVDFLNAARGEECELCKGERLTARHHEDPLCWIADCKTCKSPMAVLRRHSTTPTREERATMLNLLKGAAIPGVRYRLDVERRTIPAHWHAHLRPV